MKKFLFLLLLPLSCFSQYSIQFQQPKTPEVFSFEKYAEAPIQNYSGRANISIPLYTIEYGDIRIPLSISYTSNGIRVDEEASEIGLGWYFANAMISQTINGKDDLAENRKVMVPDHVWNYKSTYITYPQPEWYYMSTPYNDEPSDIERMNVNWVSPSSLDKYFMGKVRTERSTQTDDNLNTVPMLDLYLPYNNNLINYGPALNSHNDIDLEIDLFEINLFGESLIVYFTPTTVYYPIKTANVLNNDKYSVKVYTNSSSSTSQGLCTWVVTDANGISYTFSEELYTAYESDTGSGVSTSNITNTSTGYLTYLPYEGTNYPFTMPVAGRSFSRIWKITKISDNKGNEVLFTYTPKTIHKSCSGDSGKAHFVDIFSNYHGASPIFSEIFAGIPNEEGPMISNEVYNTGKSIRAFRYSNTDIFQQMSYPQKITFGNNELNFNFALRLDMPGKKKLDAISIKHKSNLIKNIIFNNSYFDNGLEYNHKQLRLRLDSITIGNQDFKFSYNTTPLPTKDSPSFDYWGFYNGMPNTTTINDPFREYEDSSQIPSWSRDLMPLIEGKANRSANENYCKAGILEKVYYPSGGYTKYNYELNQFDNYFFPDISNKTVLNPDNSYANDYMQTFSKGFGLRIASTMNYDADNQIISRVKYTYSGGKHIPPHISMTEEFHTAKRRQLSPNGNSGYSNNIQTSAGNKITSYSSSIYQSNILSNGNGIGYTNVTVENLDANNISNGKTVFTYVNIPDTDAREKFGTIDTFKSYVDLYGSSIRNSDKENGSLLKKEVFDRSNIKQLETVYSYKDIVPTIYQSSTYNVKLIPVPGYYSYVEATTNYQVVEFSLFDYLLFYYPLKKPKSLLDKEITTEFLNNGQMVTTTRYIYDNYYRPIETIVEDGAGIIKRETTDYFTSYQTSYKNQLLLPKKITRFEGQQLREEHVYEYNDPSNLVDQVKVRLKGTQNLDDEKRFFYDAYDEKGNIIQYHIEDGNITSVIWGYDKTLPIATLEGVQYNALSPYITNLQLLSGNDIDNYQNNGPTEALLKAQLDNLRSVFPDALIKTYTYDPLIGVTSITDPRGYTTYYEYDTNNRLKYIKDSEGNILEEYEYNYKTN